MTAPDFTLFEILAWARTKPADAEYNYNSNTNCGLCQFLRETGRAVHPSAGSSVWSDWKTSPYLGRQIVADAPIPKEMVETYTLCAGTFGALVTRLEALCPGSEWVRVEAYGRCPAGRSAALRAEPLRVSSLRAAPAIARGAA